MSEIKPFQVRLSKEMWIFLKTQSMQTGKPMNALIAELVEKSKKRIEKRLTKKDTVVS